MRRLHVSAIILPLEGLISGIKSLMFLSDIKYTSLLAIYIYMHFLYEVIDALTDSDLLLVLHNSVAITPALLINFHIIYLSTLMMKLNL
jgi:hypothetical protein